MNDSEKDELVQSQTEQSNRIQEIGEELESLKFCNDSLIDRIKTFFERSDGYALPRD